MWLKKSMKLEFSEILIEDNGSIDLPLIVDWPNRPLQKSRCERGERSALTHWHVLDREGEMQLE